MLNLFEYQMTYLKSIREAFSKMIPGLEQNTIEFDAKLSIFNTLQKRGAGVLAINGGPTDIFEGLQKDGFEIVRKKT